MSAAPGLHFTPRQALQGEAVLRDAMGVVLPVQVALNVAARSRDEAFAAIGALVQGQRRGPRADEVTEQLARREVIGTTALGNGFAIPHAHVRHLKTAITVYLRLREPIPFDAPHGELVSSILALVVPRPAMAVHHELLARLRQIAGHSITRSRLASCEDATQVSEVLASHPFV